MVNGYADAGANHCIGCDLWVGGSVGRIAEEWWQRKASAVPHALRGTGALDVHKGLELITWLRAGALLRFQMLLHDVEAAIAAGLAISTGDEEGDGT